MSNGIFIFGLNGSGKSTLGKELAVNLGYKYMDIEDYYFEESDTPYSIKRTKEECLLLIQSDIDEHKNFVFAAVTGDYVTEILSSIKLGVYINAPYDVRISRVIQRSSNKFGDRVMPGGDMFDSEEAFLSHVKNLTTSKIDKWLETVSFPIIEVDGLKDTSVNINYIKEYYQNEIVL